jgi:hypothetical protein
MNRYVVTLAKWLANKSVKAQWKAQGRNPKIGEISRATNVYFTEHEKELIREAWEHPVAIEYRHKERMRLARKAVIREIREKGRRVNSIAPEDLQKLLEAYLKEYPEDAVVKTFVCFE